MKKLLLTIIFLNLFLTPIFAAQQDVDLVSGTIMNDVRSSDPKLFSTVRFGSYPQRSTNTFDTDTIEWYICSKDENKGKALLVTKDIIDIQPYNESGEHCTWETSSLRKWLNTTFYDTAFTDEEKNCINNVSLVSKNIIGDTVTTKDNVFILGDRDITGYFISKRSSDPEKDFKYRTKGKFTNYAKSLVDEYEDGFWIRDCVENGENATWAFVSDGSYSGGPSPEVEKFAGVRPAVYINYDVNSKDRFQSEIVEKSVDIISDIYTDTNEELKKLPNGVKDKLNIQSSNEDDEDATETIKNKGFDGEDTKDNNESSGFFKMFFNLFKVFG